jgi:hypothetical protein
MKKTLLIPAAAALAVLILVGGVFAQKKPEVIGTWIGFAVGEGNRVDLTVVIDKGEAGYTGKISDATGMVPESPLKNIVFKDGRLAFEFDMASESMLIKIELTLDSETLKGAWFDPEGNSDIIELTLKK